MSDRELFDTYRNLARRFWVDGRALPETAHPVVRAEYDQLVTREARIPELEAKLKESEAKLKESEAKLKELTDVEALVTAFAICVGVNFDFSKLDERSWVFLHGACVLLGRSDLFDLHAAGRGLSDPTVKESA